MNGGALLPLQALQQGLAALRHHPRLCLGFSALACGVHLLGWALFAAGHGSGSAVIALVLHGLGVALYGGGLVWLVEGLTRIGLALGGGKRPRWRRLCRWHGRSSTHLLLGLVNTGAALAAAALAGFMAWSLTLMLLPALAPLAALLGVALCVGVALSQLFQACLVLEARLSPSRAFSQGVELLLRHWRGVLGLAPLLLLTLAAPFGLGLMAATAGSAAASLVTILAMVAALPVLACTITTAYRQLNAADLRPGAR